MKVRVISEKGHIVDGDRRVPEGTVLEVSKATMENMPDIFAPYVKRKPKPPAAKPLEPTPEPDTTGDPESSAKPDAPEEDSGPAYPVRVGESNWYRLSNGKKVQGKTQAEKAQALL